MLVCSTKRLLEGKYHPGLFVFRVCFWPCRENAYIRPIYLIVGGPYNSLTCCRFWTPPSAPAASADAPTNQLTRSGRSHQPIQRFGDAPGPAGLSLRPVSPPFFECRMCIPTSQELRVVGSDERRALMFKFDAGRKYITCASAHTPITMKSEAASYECVV